MGRALVWLVAAIRNPEPLRGRVALFHEGRCCECGMPLTHPDSIYTALGPVCLKRIEAQRRGLRGMSLAEMFEPVPM